MAKHHVGGAVREETDQDTVGRRGVLAWAVTLAGAGLAWLTGSRTAEASHSSSGTPGADNLAVHVGNLNDASAMTHLRADVANPTLVATNTPAPVAISISDGIQGITNNTGRASGVRGWNSSPSSQAAGVTGFASNLGVGVVGFAGGTSVTPPTLPEGVGVYGHSIAPAGVGVKGRIPFGATGSTVAVYGENLSSDPGPVPGWGGFGFYGFSALGHGLVGATGTAGGAAVAGSTNGVPGAMAGLFYGDLVVVGGAKSAAVANPDGTHRLLYCVESPESWFEDFGHATLAQGCAEVTLDREFGAVADLSDYHVFLSPYGNTKGLHVAERTATGFRVEEHDGGKNGIAFAWRVVAKRKDIKAERFAKVVLPPEPRHPMPPTEVEAKQPKIAVMRLKRKPQDPHADTHKDVEKEPHKH